MDIEVRWLILVFVLLTGCAKDDFVSGDGSSSAGPDASASACFGGEVRCSGNTYQVCKDGQYADAETCVPPRVCSGTLRRCADCDPNLDVCKGDDLHECSADGILGAKIKTCPPGQCKGGTCTDPCSLAAAKRSYVGCSYWPTITTNSMLAEEFSFAVVVANAGATAAEITVASAANPSLATTTVAPNSVATIKLPWVADLKQKVTALPTASKEVSVLKQGGAYHLTSSLPVTVYQFNPLNYELEQDCKNEYQDPFLPIDGRCNSFSNDASLLLPEHALTGEYMVIARPTMAFKQGAGPVSTSPGFFALVATKPGTTRVNVTFSANTQAGSPGGLSAYSKGQKASFELPQWSVLQILSQLPQSCTSTSTDQQGFGYCDLGNDTDLTGTEISADQDVAVFSGHNCAFVPFNKWACDHLEEQLIPVTSWGKQYIATHTSSSGKDPSIYRVVSAEPANEVTFDPPVHAPITLERGKFVEFATDKDFRVKGTGKLALAQFMVGQNYSNLNTGKDAPGDPAMALAVPTEQYRTSYHFLAPETFQQNYVNVIVNAGTTVELDGAPIEASKFTAIDSSGYQVAKLPIGGGSHQIESAKGFGISVYGVGSYASYMYPGGLDLKILID